MTEPIVKGIEEVVAKYLSSADRAYGEHTNAAREVMAAIEAAGFAIVPKQPTFAMLKALGSPCCNPYDRYAAMIAARPKQEDGT